MVCLLIVLDIRSPVAKAHLMLRKLRVEYPSAIYHVMSLIEPLRTG